MFQSLIVRLKTKSCSICATAGLWFQSLIVRLKTNVIIRPPSYVHVKFIGYLIEFVKIFLSIPRGFCIIGGRQNLEELGVTSFVRSKDFSFAVCHTAKCVNND